MVSKIIIETYLKSGEDFIPISDYSGKVIDEFYIEGAIFLSVDGVPILTIKEWDLVDQLWAYLGNAVAEIRNGLPYSSGFPDQPLELAFDLVGDRRVKITVGERSVISEKDDLIRALCISGSEFFTRLSALEGRPLADYSFYLSTFSIAD